MGGEGREGGREAEGGGEGRAEQGMPSSMPATLSVNGVCVPLKTNLRSLLA